VIISLDLTSSSLFSSVSFSSNTEVATKPRLLLRLLM